jgi:hypothetical protein
VGGRITTIMSHELELFVGKRAMLERLRACWPDAQLYQLTPNPEFATLPIMDWEAYEHAQAEGLRVPEGWAEPTDLSPEEIQYLAAFSAGAALAYVQTNYFGGRGWQGAILWRDGTCVYGPEVMWVQDEAGRSAAEWPINRALRGLGVQSSLGRDEFATVGLGYRSYRDLIENATLLT